MNTTKTHAYIFIVISLLGATAAGISGVVFARTVYAQYVVVHTMQEDRSRLVTREGHISSLRTLARETAEQRAVLAGIAEVGDPAAHIRAVQQIAEDAGVSVSTASVSTGDASIAAGAKTPVVELVMRTRGTFRNVLQFLALLENSPVPLFVEHVSLEQVDQGGSWTMTVRLVHVAYRQEK